MSFWTQTVGHVEHQQGLWAEKQIDGSTRQQQCRAERLFVSWFHRSLTFVFPAY